MNYATALVVDIALAILAFDSSLTAHDEAVGVVKERMQDMAKMAKSMKAIARYMKSNDLVAIRKEAKATLPLAANIPRWFPPGSDQHPSEAKADVWKNWSDFQSKANKLEVEIGKLAVIDTNNPNAVSVQVRAVSQTCGECREQYRQKKK
jgi:cytochrome c556